MKLYLSSYRLGDSASDLQFLVKRNKRIGVVSNALDFLTDAGRLREKQEEEFSDLEAIDLNPVAIDLRDYFDDPASLRTVVERLDALWVVGGHSFVLNSAMHRCGLSDILYSKLADEDFVYAGYSAGICVLTPTLEGIHILDKPEVQANGYPGQLPWEGLGIVPFCIAPHWRSDHRDSPFIEKSVDYFIDHKMPFIALRDGEVYIASVDEMPNKALQPTPESDRAAFGGSFPGRRG
jgi:dipeptidase E